MLIIVLEKEVTRMSLLPASLPGQASFPKYSWKMSWHLHATYLEGDSPLQLVPVLDSSSSKAFPSLGPKCASLTSICWFFFCPFFSPEHTFLNFWIFIFLLWKCCCFYTPFKNCYPARDTKSPKGLPSTDTRVDWLLGYCSPHTHEPIPYFYTKEYPYK